MKIAEMKAKVYDLSKTIEAITIRINASDDALALRSTQKEIAKLNKAIEDEEKTDDK